MPIAGRARALESLILGGICAGLAACATDGAGRAGTVDEAPAPVAAAAQPVTGPVGVLAPRELEAGECGLFLYARRAEPQFIFFAQDGAGTAQMNLDGAEESLTRSEAAVQRELATQQAYQGEGGLRVELSLEIGEALTGGIRIPAGSLRLSQPDGWDLVIPVTGLSACQSTE